MKIFNTMKNLFHGKFSAKIAVKLPQQTVKQCSKGIYVYVQAYRLPSVLAGHAICDNVCIFYFRYWVAKTCLSPATYSNPFFRIPTPSPAAVEMQSPPCDLSLSWDFLPAGHTPFSSKGKCEKSKLQTQVQLKGRRLRMQKKLVLLSWQKKTHNMAKYSSHQGYKIMMLAITWQCRKQQTG